MLNQTLTHKTELRLQTSYDLIPYNRSTAKYLHSGNKEKCTQTKTTTELM